MSTKSKHKESKSRVVQKKNARKNMFPSDEESVELRRLGAEAQAARVTRLDLGRRVFGAYQVDSTQWKAPYRVEIRSLTEALNTCSCSDHGMNRLGTCKHVERVLQVVGRETGKRVLEAARQAGSDRYELFMDVRVYPPRLTLLSPAVKSEAVERRLGKFFGADGAALGAPLETFRSVERACAALPPAQRKQVVVSHHIQPWMERFAHEEALAKVKDVYLRDVQEGKRASNPVAVPLYPYQYDGMMHLAFKGRAMLADEMGLGKTVQAIAAAELLRQLGHVKRALVICPASLKSEWEEQYRFFTGQRADLLFGPRPERLRRYAEQPPFLVLNYEQARSDVDDINRLYAPDLTILDEAQRIKNWPTKTAKTIKRVSSPFAFVLTGTPLENRIEELYSLAEFVNPHLFGSLFRFQREFMQPEPEGPVRPKNLDELHRRISTVMLRRRKRDVEESLPERTDKNFFVTMTEEQLLRYRDYEQPVRSLVNIMKSRPLTKEEMDRLQMLLGCMRMVCDTPYILDPECRHCPKLDELENILDELASDPETKMLIFSEWTGMLSLVQELLREKGLAYALHTGQVAQKKRRDEINRFKSDPGCRVFLSTESGGAGLNLQAASVVINLDLPWNPAKLEQRIARAWRKNQQRHVRVINLVAENTIEHSMLARLACKQALSDAVLDGAAIPEYDGNYQSFAQRVASLMNISLDNVPVAKAAGRKEPATPETARDYLVARYRDRLLAIQRERANDALLVVARGADDASRIRDEMAAEAAFRTPVEVVDAATAEVLQRLQQQGLIQFSPHLEAFFSAPGYEPEGASKKPLHLDQARALWQTADRPWKAAQALLSAELDEMAIPHLVTAATVALEALALLEQGTRSPARHFEPSAYGAHAGLARNLFEWVENATKETAPDVDSIADMIRAFQSKIG